MFLCKLLRFIKLRKLMLSNVLLCDLVLTAPAVPLTCNVWPRTHRTEDPILLWVPCLLSHLQWGQVLSLHCLCVPLSFEDSRLFCTVSSVWDRLTTGSDLMEVSLAGSPQEALVWPSQGTRSGAGTSRWHTPTGDGDSEPLVTVTFIFNHRRWMEMINVFNLLFKNKFEQ